jgi:hypothetical protein
MHPASVQNPLSDDTAPSAEHVSTTLSPSEEQGVLEGVTTWRLPLKTGSVELSWEWLQLRPGVLVLKDPINIAAKPPLVQHLTGDSHEASPIKQLNNLVHQTPWQPTVEMVIARSSQPAI